MSRPSLLVSLGRLALAASLALVPGIAGAQTATPPPYVPAPYVVPTEDPSIPQYNDITVHFTGPKGWKKVVLGADPSDADTVNIAFVQGTASDDAAIGVTIAPTDENLQAFDNDHEQQLRGDSGYVEHRIEGHLANGMPAIFLQSATGTDLTSKRRFEWLVVDGKRSILVSEISRRGVLEQDDARKDLSSLSVVVYPGMVLPP